MTPIQNPTTLEETSFNNAQTRTRAKIEQVNGQLKNKFRCLLGDGMQIEPQRACDIIVACCILFNISKDLKEPHLDPQRDQQVQPDPDEAGAAPDNVHGAAVRADIITNFFT
ncbi:putative nuclease HARBI1 isoform X2 [Apostichopus japonicus]|uniref:Putative nuclease HARBI1 isoform X2 n=2 Tax=Stichopus japonicus TaxID=307972 RepID=A0A2G8K670_STIJA|nr:putative nuclease HARBI1 isoform X2 [Apostichopus japonicus]